MLGTNAINSQNALTIFSLLSMAAFILVLSHACSKINQIKITNSFGEGISLQRQKLIMDLCTAQKVHILDQVWIKYQVDHTGSTLTFSEKNKF